jgi:ABC-type amino acid transport substrate-binding protein
MTTDRRPSPLGGVMAGAIGMMGAAILLAGAGGMAALAQDNAEPPMDPAPAYVVGVENLYYLPAYAIEDGAYTGFARELLDAFAADSGLTLRYEPLPVPRLYASLAADVIDLKFPDSPHWNPAFREGRDLSYSVSVVDYLDATIVPAAHADMAPQDIRTLGTVTGFTPYPWLDRIAEGSVTVAENADFRALVRQVLAGRVDAAYANIAVVNRVLDQEFDQPGALVAAPALPRDAGAYRLSTIAHPELVASFDAWMTANAERVAALKARHAVEQGVHSKE